MTAKRRPSKAVYRRRRLVALILVLLVLAGLGTGGYFGVRWLVDNKPWQNLPFVGNESAPEEVEDPIPTIYPTSAPPSVDPSATPTPEEEEPVACAAGVLQLVAHTDKGEYAGGENPLLTMELTNTGDVDCLVNVGTSAQWFEIASGPDVWWRSRDCQTEPEDAWVTISAGQNVTTEDPLEWNRSRSYDDTCDADERPAALPGTYNLTVHLDELSSQPSSFILY